MLGPVNLALRDKDIVQEDVVEQAVLLTVDRKGPGSQHLLQEHMPITQLPPVISKYNLDMESKETTLKFFFNSLTSSLYVFNVFW